MQEQGLTTQLTKEFQQLREDHKTLVSQIMADKMSYLEKSCKTETKVDGFASLLASMVGNGYCRSCGSPFTVFNSNVECFLCKEPFCRCVLRTWFSSFLHSFYAVFCEVCFLIQYF